MKNKHRIRQGLSLLLAGGIALTNLGAVMPAFAEDAPATPETAEATTPETAEANVPIPNLSQITENLYNDLPDAPTGSYLGSMGLPVATGETKIGISAWVSDLYDGVDAHMDADALNADENTVTIGKTPGTDYAIVPLLAQVEYPADGAVHTYFEKAGITAELHRKYPTLLKSSADLHQAIMQEQLAPCRAPETEWERQMLRTEVKHYIDTSGLAYSYNEFYTQNMPDKVAWKTLQSDLFANLPQIKAERMPQDFSVVLPKLWRKRQAWDAERTKRPPYRGEER